jgi:hypothetical protein
MTSSNKKIISPTIQVTFFSGMAVVGLIGAKIMAKDPLTIWMIAASSLLLFSLMNNIQSVSVKKYKKYLIQSIYLFMFMLIGMVLLATGLSGMSVFDAGSYRTIFTIVLIANFIFIAIVMLVRGFLVFLEEKDENFV